MARHKLELTPCDMLLGRYTMTQTGWPARQEIVRTAFPAVHPSLDVHGGWYWIPCSEGSSEWIREHGHHAVGSVITTFIPPQNKGQIDTSVQPEDVPVCNTSAYVEYAMAHGRGPS
jgi:hypothetical protein